MCKIIEAFCNIENIYPINYTCNGCIHLDTCNTVSKYIIEKDNFNNESNKHKENIDSLIIRDTINVKEINIDKLNK